MMLSEEEKIRYVSGQGMWHTNGLDGKMPQIHLSDGPHGLRSQEEGELRNNDSYTATCFPSACCSACSFDPKLIGRMAAAIAEEAKEQGVSAVRTQFRIFFRRSVSGGNARRCLCDGDAVGGRRDVAETFCRKFAGDLPHDREFADRRAGAAGNLSDGV